MSDTGDMLDLSGASAVVTGSTRGIGATIAKKLSAAGASVVVSGRTENAGNELVDEIRAEGRKAVFCPCDVRNPEDIKHLIITAHEQHGGLDILVNNAAFETDTSPETVSLDTWEAIIETDFRAYWLSAKYAYPFLTEDGGGSIVNIGSNHSSATQPKKFPYNAIKAGIDGITRAMAVAWGADGIRVNSVNPGWTMVERIADGLSDEEIDYLDRIHPMGRIGTPEDVANAVLFLSCQMSDFITGECIKIDGGRTAVLQDNLYVNDLDIND